LAQWLALTPLLGAFSAVVLFYWKLLFTNQILARGDTFFYIYPYWTAAAEGLRAGRLALWNPFLFMGAPLLANSQAGLLYPLNWPLWLVLDVPKAVSVSIALHVGMALLFAYKLVRHGLHQSRLAGVAAGLLFALGGYFSAQVEHVNQVQGLAWLPAVLWLISGCGASRHSRVLRLCLLALVLAMQVLAGHTQASFITLVGGAVYGGWLSWSMAKQSGGRGAPVNGADKGWGPRRVFLSWLGWPLICLVLAGALALLLAAAQVLPAQELLQHSIRSTGLPADEAVSFSLHPLLLGRSLLPAAGETLFSEYVAFLPLTALLLALAGLSAGWRRPAVKATALLAFTGLFFALGAANPVYLLLVRLVPGFDLFRAPARWLALYALGTAVLAGVGLDAAAAGGKATLKRPLAAWCLLCAVLVGWSFLAPMLAPALPAVPESIVTAPNWTTVTMWAIEAVVAIALVWLVGRTGADRTVQLMLLVCLAVLLISSRALPYNHPTAAEAHSGLRPAVAHLKAAASLDGHAAPGRFLSVSDLLFDPGDSGELKSIYSDQLDEAALYDLIIATKQKEVLTPNLPLNWEVPAVDGYDGGLLPLAKYTALVQRMLPDGGVATDGRLRENLNEVPDGRWLKLFNVRFVVTDKVGDAWADGFYFDLQHRALLDGANAAVRLPYLPQFESTGAGIVVQRDDSPAGGALGEVLLDFESGRQEVLTLTAPGQSGLTLCTDADGTEWVVSWLRWSQPGILTGLSFRLTPSSMTPNLHIGGLTLLDHRDGSFQSLVVSIRGSFRLVHSGDVKIYENLDVLPRAWLVGRWRWSMDDEQTLTLLQSEGFDPAAEVVLAGTGLPGERTLEVAGATVIVLVYEPERVIVQVDAPHDGWLVLSDAFYPGWEASVDGNRATIERADVLFRAIRVSAGSHQVSMRFRPTSLRVGAVISVVALLSVLLVAGWSLAGTSARPIGSESQRRSE
jgi:hypothetical protein